MPHGSALRALPSGLKHEFSMYSAFLPQFVKDGVLAKASPGLVLQSQDLEGGMFLGQAPKNMPRMSLLGGTTIFQIFSMLKNENF